MVVISHGETILFGQNTDAMKLLKKYSDGICGPPIATEGVRWEKGESVLHHLEWMWVNLRDN